MESLKLEWGGVGELGKGDGLAVDAAEEPAAGGEDCEERLEAVNGDTVLVDARGFLTYDRWGWLGWIDWRAGVAKGGKLLIVEEQRSQSAPHVPFDIVGKHAEEHVCAHAWFSPMKDGPNAQAKALEGTKCPFDLRERLIRSHGIGCGELVSRLAGSNDVETIQGSLSVDGVLAAFP